MLIILVLALAGISNKKISQETKLDKIVKEYSQSAEEMDQAYAQTVGDNGYVTLEQVKELIKEVKLETYPVGSIYISTNSANPSTYIGGTWERFANGRALVGIDESDTEPNEKINFNKPAETLIGSKYLQSHNHVYNHSFMGRADHAAGNYSAMDVAGKDYGIIGNTGAGDSENIPPSILVYIWKRIS